MDNRHVSQTIDPDYDIQPLVLAMAEQAATQAKRGDRSAALWLATDGALMLEFSGAHRAAERLGELGRAVFWNEKGKDKT